MNIWLLERIEDFSSEVCGIYASLEDAQNAAATEYGDLVWKNVIKSGTWFSAETGNESLVINQIQLGQWLV